MGAVPGKGAEKGVLPGDSTHAASIASISGQGLAGAHKEGEPEAGSASAVRSDDGIGAWLALPGGVMTNWAMVAPVDELGMLCAPDMMCIPKIPAMMAKAAVSRPARRRNAGTGPRGAAIVTFLLPCWLGRLSVPLGITAPPVTAPGDRHRKDTPVGYLESSRRVDS